MRDASGSPVASREMSPSHSHSYGHRYRLGSREGAARLDSGPRSGSGSTPDSSSSHARHRSDTSAFEMQSASRRHRVRSNSMEGWTSSAHLIPAVSDRAALQPTNSQQTSSNRTGGAASGAEHEGGLLSDTGISPVGGARSTLAGSTRGESRQGGSVTSVSQWMNNPVHTHGPSPPVTNSAGLIVQTGRGSAQSGGGGGSVGNGGRVSAQGSGGLGTTPLSSPDDAQAQFRLEWLVRAITGLNRGLKRAEGGKLLESDDDER